jgi:protein O-mannosyl-transferase
MTPTTAPTQQEDSRNASAPPSAETRSPFSSREQTLLVILLLAASTLLLYRPVLDHQFVMYDDVLYLVQNGHVQNGLTWDNVRWAFTATVAENWHPLTWLSHMTDVQLFHFKPMGHHLDSMLWHALNVLLLFFLLRAATGYLWRSAAVAGLFAFCPLNVECVAWIAERKSLVSTTFFLLSLFAYGWYVRRPSAARYLAAASLFALGLMAKPMVITLPILLLLADYWPLGRIQLPAPGSNGSEFHKRFAQLAFEKVPLLLLSAGSAAITLYAQRVGGNLTSTTQVSVPTRLENAIYSYALYIVKMFWPSHLAVFHPYPTLNPWMVVAAGLALVAITAVVWRYRRNGPLAVGWAWYLVTLVPVIGIIQVSNQGWAERYAYLPYMGLFVAIVWTIAGVVERFHWSRWAPATAAVVALLAYAWVSHVQIGYWQNSYTLFEHANEVTSRNGVAETSLGILAYTAGHLNEAEQHYRKAIEYMPYLGEARNNLQLVLMKEGRVEEAQEAAVDFCNYTLRMNPDDAGCLLGRGRFEYRKKQFDSALRDLAKAAELSPSAKTYTLLGEAYEAKGNAEEAKGSYQKALEIDPTFAEASSKLAALVGSHAP